MTDSSNSLPETVDSLKADLRPEELTAIMVVSEDWLPASLIHLQPSSTD